jgi:hypothetical protein
MQEEQQKVLNALQRKPLWLQVQQLVRHPQVLRPQDFLLHQKHPPRQTRLHQLQQWLSPQHNPPHRQCLAHPLALLK